LPRKHPVAAVLPPAPGATSITRPVFFRDAARLGFDGGGARPGPLAVGGPTPSALLGCYMAHRAPRSMVCHIAVPIRIAPVRRYGGVPPASRMPIFSPMQITDRDLFRHFPSLRQIRSPLAIEAMIEQLRRAVQRKNALITIHPRSGLSMSAKKSHEPGGTPFARLPWVPPAKRKTLVVFSIGLALRHQPHAIYIFAPNDSGLALRANDVRESAMRHRMRRIAAIDL